jgi:hypothetical protein
MCRQWIRFQKQEYVPLFRQRFDVYEKIDGTNVGLIAWPPEKAGGLLGRNYVIPDDKDTYQSSPLKFLRDPKTVRNGTEIAKFLIDQHRPDFTIESVETIVLFGEMVLQDRGEKYGYFDRRSEPLLDGDWLLFGALVVYADDRDAKALSAHLSKDLGMVTKLRLERQNGVQIFLNTAFENHVNSCPTAGSYFRLPNRFANNEGFFEALESQKSTICVPERSKDLEGVVLTSSSEDVMAHDNYESDVVFKWKTAENDDSNSEKQLRRLHGLLSTRHNRDKYPKVFGCVQTFLDAYHDDPSRTKRPTCLPNEKKESVDVDHNLIELLANSALTKVDKEVFGDRSIPKEERVRIASALSEDIVSEYLQMEPDTAVSTHSDVRNRAYSAVWKLSKK